MTTTSAPTDIAVIGLASRLPGAPDSATFWENLRAGVESVSFFDDERLLAAGVRPETLADPRFVRAWAAVDDADLFDAHFFGYSAREATLLDPQHRLFLECAWRALEDAGHPPTGSAGDIGVYAGSSLSSYLLANLLPGRGMDVGTDGLELLIANDKDYLANRVSYKLDLGGPAVCVQSACSTSLVAVHLACQGLLNYDCDLALAGGVTVRFPQVRGYLYQEGMILSPDGHCRPFDAAARGTVSGSGVGVVVLRRLADALADGDRVDAVIRATAVNNDGAAKVGYTAPSVEGQARVISATLGLADIDAASIQAIEAHGTGTPLGDPIEIAALTRVFRRYSGEREFCAVSSVKSNIGHLDSAAGIASLIKAVLQLKHGELAPSINFRTPNPDIDFPSTPFYVNAELQPWKTNGDPRRIGVSSFGFGGTNAHAILEEAPAPVPTASARNRHVIMLSAKTAPALDEMGKELAVALRTDEPIELADVAYTLQNGRRHFAYRRALVCADPQDVAQRLAAGGPAPRPVTDQARVAWLFPGQGSQYVDMGRELYATEPVYREHLDRCAALLRPELDLDLIDLLHVDGPVDGPVDGADRTAAGDRLEQTAVAQPALFAVEYALARLLEHWNVGPAAMIGHSVGEFAAACLAGVFDLADAVRLVAARGRLMQAMPTGSMLSVALDEAVLTDRLPRTLSLAAVNGPELCVVSGPDDAVRGFAADLTAAGIASRLLHTSHAFHSAMMAPVVEAFTAEVSRTNLRPPARPYLSTRTGDWITDAQATDPAYWGGHLRDTVRFAAGIRRLLDAGTNVLVEVGPGTTLASLARMAPGARAATVVSTLPAPDQPGDAAATVLEALGRLWLAGVDVDWPTLYAGERRRRLSLPGYAFQRRRYFAEPAVQEVPGGPADLDVADDAPPAPVHPSTVDARPALLTEYLAPRCEVEERIAAIWQNLLGVAPVGVRDNFIELGGHSLLATKVVARIEEELGVAVPLRRLVRASTVEALAALVAELGGTRTAATATTAAVDLMDELPVATADWEHLHDPFPLSEMQQAQWIGRMSNFSLGNVGAHMYWEVERDGLDVARLNAAWNRVVARHAMLRAVFTDDGYQRILPEVTRYDFPVDDLRAAAPDSVADHLAALRARMSHEMRPADRWPLFEIRAVLLPDGRTRLFLSFELMMADMGSTRILLRDWRAYYERPDVELPELGISYRDYRLAAAQLKQTELYRRSMEYWRERIAELPAAPQLPLATAPEQITDPKFVPHSATIPTPVWHRIKQRAARYGVTPSTAVLAAYACVLGAWTRAGRFTLNVTTNIRLPVHRDVEDLVGGFASFTLLPVDLVADDSVGEVARRLQEQNWQDLEYRYVNGVDILREMARQRGGTTGAVMPAVFTSTLVNEAEDNEESMVDWLGDLRHQIIQTPQVWLDVAVLEVAKGLFVGWPAVAELFPDGLIADMFEAFRQLLHQLGAADDESAWSGTVPLLPPDQRALIAVANDTAAPVPQGLLFSPLAHRAALTPTAPAVIAADTTLTFAELFGHACALAWRLRSLGVGPNQLVAVAVEKSAAQVVAALGVVLAGGAYLPVDPDLPADRQDFLLEHSGARTLVSRPAGRGWPDSVRVVELDLGPAVPDDGPPPCVSDPADLAYVLYTSGSTGTPKGVAVSHRAALNTCVDVNARYQIGPTDRVLGLSSLSFDLSVWDIFGVLGAGGAVVLPLPAARRDPAAWYRLVHDHGVTVWNSVPALMSMYLEHGEARGLRSPGIRRVLLSGDWIPLDLPDRIRAHAPEAQVISLGGATEAAIWSIAYPVGAIDPRWESIPYGRPLTNQSFAVLNDRMRPCPVWVEGELYIGGVGLADGYWRDPERTAAAFVTDPRTGQRWYRTGDLGRWLPDGTIEFRGRDDFQVKIGGFRIELGEVEHALAEHPGVAFAVAAAVGPDRHRRQLAGYVVPAAGRPRDPGSDAALATEVREHAQARLPQYMVPPTITVLDEVPLSANGKVDRGRLPEPAQGPAPRRAPAAVSELAVRLAAIAAEAIGAERVDPLASFFELGGDSITGVRIISRVNEEGIDLRLQDLFEAQSIADLADRLTARGVGRTEPAGPPATLPVTAYQARLLAVGAGAAGTAGTAGTAGAAGVQRVEVRVDPDLDPTVIEQAWAGVLARHPALRTRFEPADGGWTQRVAVAGPDEAYVPLIELGGLPAEHRAESMAAMVAELCDELDVTRGPLARTVLFDLGAARRVLVCLASELVVDGRSWEILLADLFSAVAQLRAGDTVVLPAPGDGFDRWVRGAAAPGPGAEAATVDGATARMLMSTVDIGPLLDAARDAYRVGPDELVPGALALALRGPAGPGPTVAVLRDGRFDADNPLNLTRTVGCFTVLSAVPAGLTEAADPTVLLSALKRWHRAPAEPPAAVDVAVQCLGRFGADTHLHRLLPPDNDDLVPVWNSAAPLARVRVTVAERGGVLRVRWTSIDPAVDLERVAAGFADALHTLADHCAVDGAEHLTPEDFPLADLGTDELAIVLRELGEDD